MIALFPIHNRNLLTQADGTSRFMIPASVTGLYTRELQLPAGLTCSQCVLQWRYHAGTGLDIPPVAYYTVHTTMKVEKDLGLKQFESDSSQSGLSVHTTEFILD